MSGLLTYDSQVQGKARQQQTCETLCSRMVAHGTIHQTWCTLHYKGPPGLLKQQRNYVIKSSNLYLVHANNL